MNYNIKNLQIEEDVSIKTALKRMDSAAIRILFVVDRNQRLLGTLTDGDIRKCLIATGKLYVNIKRAYNKRPVYTDSNYDITAIKEIMVNKRIECIPVVNDSRRITGLLLWEDIFGEEYKVQKKQLNMPVVIMAGGEGTRMAPFTKILPKPLIPIGDQPVLEYIINSFIKNGCNKFVLILGYKAEMIRSYFDNTTKSYNISYIKEQKPLGTCGGLKLLPQKFNRTFFVSNCDVLITADYEDIYNFHKKQRNDITIVGSLRHFTIPYGVMKTKNGELKEIIEKPEHDFLVNTGLYILEKSMLQHIPKNKPFDFTDLIKKAKDKSKKIAVYPISEKSWTDVGKWDVYKRSLSEFEL